MEKNNFKKKLEIEVVVIASFLSFLLLFFFFKSTNFSIQDYSKLYIGQATLDNIDISKRVTLFFKLVFGLLVLLPMLYYGLKKLKIRFSISNFVQKPIFIISFLGVSFLFLDIIGIQSKDGIVFFVCYFLYSIGLIFFHKLVFNRIEESDLNLFYNPIIISLSFVFLTSIIFFFNSYPHLFEIGLASFFLFNFFLTFFIKIIHEKTDLFYRQLFKVFVPFCLVPLFIFISIESVFFFKINHDFFPPYKWIFVLMVLISFGINFLLNRIKKSKLSSNELLKFFFVPSALISFLLLVLYHPYIDQSTEIFELANTANAQMRLFEFKEIPFVDYMSSHMFSEQFYGIIYAFFFGYNKDLDFISYSFLYTILFYLVSYVFLLKLFKNSFLIFLFLIFFPFVHILLNTHLFFGVILFLSIQKLIENQNIRNYLIVFFIGILLFVWRLDTGAATMMATVFYFPILFVSERIKINTLNLLKALASLVVFIILVLIIVLFIKSPEYLLSNFKCAIHYASANQAHGYSLLSNSYPQQFYLFYFIFPVTAVFIILFVIYILRTKSYQINRFSTFCLHSSLFLFLLYLSNFQRGIVRHSFMENNDTIISSTFYIALVLFILSFNSLKDKLNRFLIFYILSFGLLLIFQYFPINQGVSNIDHYLEEPTIKNTDLYFQKDKFKGRIIKNEIFAKDNYIEFKKFLNNKINEKQTFMDFSNTPMLYFNCQRNVPSYFCQNLQNTVDDFLQFEHIKAIPLKSVPIVVYSNYPTTWFDRTDNVPNSMRQYLIAEHIYRNYKPLGILSKHSIWVAKKSNIKLENIEKDTLITQPQIYNYKHSASIIYHHFMDEKPKKIKKIIHLKPSHFSDSSKSTFFNLPNTINTEKGVFISFSFERGFPSQEIKFEIIGGNGIIGTTTFNTSELEKNYMVRLSNHYLWHIQKPKYIRILNLGNLTLPNIQLYKDLRDGY